LFGNIILSKILRRNNMINIDSNKTYQSFEVFYKINYFGEFKFNIWDFLWQRVYCKFVGQSALRNKSAAKKKRMEQAEKMS